jgi:hypothetical protein
MTFASGTYFVTSGEKMSTEVSPTIKSTPVALLAQDVKQPQHSSSAKPTQSGPSSPARTNSQAKEVNTQQTGTSPTSSIRPEPHSPISDGSTKTSNLSAQGSSAITFGGSPDNFMTEEEIQLEASLELLWSSQKTKTSSLRRSRQSLELLRVKLSAELHHYKQLLSQTGRGGRWTAFLEAHNIPRATADRYVKKHEQSLMPLPTKCLAGAISVPTHDEILGLVKKFKPKLVSVLTTAESVAQFVTELSKALDLTKTIS